MDVSTIQRQQKFKLHHELRRLSNFLDLYLKKEILLNEIPETEITAVKNKIDEFSSKYLSN